jgi:hypothetical protein
VNARPTPEGLEHLVQDLRAHASEAPAVCAALMRRAATELECLAGIGPFARAEGGKHRQLQPGAVSCDS